MLHSLKIHHVLIDFLDENLHLAISEGENNKHNKNNISSAIFFRYKKLFEKSF